MIGRASEPLSRCDVGQWACRRVNTWLAHTRRPEGCRGNSPVSSTCLGGVALRLQCPRCGARTFWILKDGRRRCTRCRFDWRPGRLPLRLTAQQWRSILRWFARGAPKPTQLSDAAPSRTARMRRSRLSNRASRCSGCMPRTAVWGPTRPSATAESQRRNPARAAGAVPGRVCLALQPPDAVAGRTGAAAAAAAASADQVALIGLSPGHERPVKGAQIFHAGVSV